MNSKNRHTDEQQVPQIQRDVDSHTHPYMHMNNYHDVNIIRPFVYTIIIFLLLCLVSFVVSAQAPVPTQSLQDGIAQQSQPATAQAPSRKDLSLNEALLMARENNREIKIARLDIDRSGQDKIVARSLILPSAGVGAQVDHYFMLPPFFGFGSCVTSAVS